jgi:hypothetical protein
MLLKTKLNSRDSFLLILEFLFCGSKKLRSMLNFLHNAGDSFYLNYVDTNNSIAKDFKTSGVMKWVSKSLEWSPKIEDLLKMGSE